MPGVILDGGTQETITEMSIDSLKSRCGNGKARKYAGSPLPTRTFTRAEELHLCPLRCLARSGCALLPADGFLAPQQKLTSSSCDQNVLVSLSPGSPPQPPTGGRNSGAPKALPQFAQRGDASCLKEFAPSGPVSAPHRVGMSSQKRRPPAPCSGDRSSTALPGSTV